jgi:hypothetical protein
MANLKSIIIKQLYSKFKASYFLSLCLLLSLSSCTSEELDEVIGVAILIGIIWMIIFPILVVYFILFLFHALRFLYYTYQSNKEIEGGLRGVENRKEVVAEVHQVKKENRLVITYFIVGLIPIFLCFVFLIMISWEYYQLILVLILGAFGLLFVTFVFHLGATYMLYVTRNITPRLLSKNNKEA